MNILFVTAHPDDAEVFCGGTIVKYVNKGNRVKILICTNGNLGSLKLTKNKIAEIRKKEAQDSAKILGTELEFLNYNDGFFPCKDDARIKIVDEIRMFKTDLVFTHYSEGYLYKDHNNVSKITSEAVQIAHIKNVESKYKPIKKMPYIYYFENLTGIGFEPEEYVDITNEIEIKKEALSQHKSQFELMNFDLNDFIMTKAKFRGYQCDCKYSEAFIGFGPYVKKIEKSSLPQYL